VAPWTLKLMETGFGGEALARMLPSFLTEPLVALSARRTSARLSVVLTGRGAADSEHLPRRGTSGVERESPLSEKTKDELSRSLRREHSISEGSLLIGIL
jgi:hypothetical protein